MPHPPRSKKRSPRPHRESAASRSRPAAAASAAPDNLNPTTAQVFAAMSETDIDTIEIMNAPRRQFIIRPAGEEPFSVDHWHEVLKNLGLWTPSTPSLPSPPSRENQNPT